MSTLRLSCPVSLRTAGVRTGAEIPSGLRQTERESERQRERDREREVGQDLAFQVLDLMHGCSTPSLDFVFR